MGSVGQTPAVKMSGLGTARYELLFFLITCVGAPVPKGCGGSSGEPYDAAQCTRSYLSSIGMIVGSVLGAVLFFACCMCLCCRDSLTNNDGDTNLTTDQRLERIEAAITLRNNEETGK